MRRITAMFSLTVAAVVAAGATYAISNYLDRQARESRFSELLEKLQIERQTRNPPELQNPRIMKSIQQKEIADQHPRQKKAAQSRANARID